MTAPRTRSLSELPGHLRVPILRRKDTQRTRERLAAGVAGMEELRSLRQQQQQLVGKTVAEAGDKRHERTRCSYGGDWADTVDDGYSLAGQQTPLHSPRHPVPHPRSYFFGQSMDSILEEENGHTNNGGSQCDLDPNTTPTHQPDVNNNNSNNKTPIIDSFKNKSPSPDHLSQDESNSNPRPRSWSFDYLPSPTAHAYDHDYHPHTNSTNSASPNNQKHIHQSSGNETKHRSTLQQTAYNNNQCNSDSSPAQFSHEIDTTPMTVTRKQHQNPNEDRTTMTSAVAAANAPTPTRRRSLSLRPCHDHHQQPTVSLRQRSMSVDMGHQGMKKSSQLLPQPFLPNKHGNIHNRFSSLNSINHTDNNDNTDKIHNLSRDMNTSMSFEEGRRLSQSMTQINDAGNGNPRSTALKRRGSLTWDSLLKSIGIQDSASDSQNQNSETEQNNTTEKGGDSDGVFGSDISSTEDKANSALILQNRKKGRSMSFTCGNTLSPLMTSPKHYRMNLTRQNAVMGDADGNDGRPEPAMGTSSSAGLDSTPSRSIHPILRRASIQCEAVLTNSSRVVNPIQDVDVTSFNSPGPLHAVMLQYKGYKKNAPSTRADQTDKNSSTTTCDKLVTRVSGTQDIISSSNDSCLSSVVRPNTVNHRISHQSTKNSSDLASSQQPRVGEMAGVIRSGSAAATEKHDQVECCNVTQKDKHTVSREGSCCVNDNVSNSNSEELCNERNGSAVQEPIKHHNANLLGLSTSPLTLTPDLAAEELEKSNAKGNSNSNSQVKNSMGEDDESRSALRKSPKLPADVVNKPAPHREHDVGMSSPVKDPRDSRREVNRERAEGNREFEYAITSPTNPTRSSNYNNNSCDYNPRPTLSREGASNYDDDDSDELNSAKASSDLGYQKISVQNSRNSKKMESNSNDTTGVGVGDININQQRQNVNNNNDIRDRGVETMYPATRHDQRMGDKAEHAYNDNRLPQTGYDISSYSATLELPDNADGRLFRRFISQPQHEAHELYNNNDHHHQHRHSLGEVDVVIRDKRSSIFSDVSGISDLSTKTPSSSASVLSDVSMVSDEGYNTCESTSPDGKMTHLKRLSSMHSSFSHPSTTTTTQYPRHDISSSSVECLNNFVRNNNKRENTDSRSRDQNGNDVMHNNDCKNHRVDGYFRNEKGDNMMTVDRTAPVVRVRPVMRQTPNSNDNQQCGAIRKLSKQTTV